jgi:hypothetical protein
VLSPDLGRRDQIRYHARVIDAHLGHIARHTRALLWSLPGLFRALLGL